MMMTKIPSRMVLAAILLSIASAIPAQPPETTTPHPRIVESRAIVRQFGAELKAALERAIAEQGPVHAISVCRDEAPRIAARLTAQHGAMVARTALRVRNPANAPSRWQRVALHDLQERLAGGAHPQTLESFEMGEDGSARYLKAIITAPLCTVCHGESIAPEIRRAVMEHYPEDQATGFRTGDLRGAFSVEWPADPAKE
jgi:hypothetical protein